MIENRVRVRLCAMLQGRGEVRRKEDAKSWEKGIEKSPLAMGKWGFMDEELRCMDLTQIDEFLSVANIELAADGLRHFATVEIVDRGLMLALWLYVRSTKVRLLRVLDNIAIATPVTAGCIRLGNLMNSEIVGTYTHSDFGFVFARLGETQPRHPAQLYEAIAYFVLLVIGWLLYRTHRDKVGTGFFFGLCLTFIFVFRFGVEFFKEVQEPWELHMQGLIGINQGQLLSVPFILIGLYCMFGCKLPTSWYDRSGRYYEDEADSAKK